MFSDSEVVSSWLRSEVVSGRVFNFRNEMIETVMTRQNAMQKTCVCQDS